MLYEAAAFEPLTGSAWDDARVREAISEIVVDTDGAFDHEELWPADEWDSWNTPLPLKNLYVGAAGVVWALDVLRRRGLAESRLDLAATARRTLELWRTSPDFMAGVERPEPARAGLLTAESGLLVALWRLDPEPEVADDLYARIRENVDNPADEVMWGSPGTMLAARAMLDWTAEERWAEAWRESAGRLLGKRDADGLWTQQLYGESSRHLGPPHGLVGNVLALLGGRELLGAEMPGALSRESADALRRAAVIEDGLANWPMAEGEPLRLQDGELRVQWCTGAPGIVASASSYLDDDLFFAGVELTWRAGPHGPVKGPGICHGTAGNGYALLKAFERTHDERWLERARRFAVHALDQVRGGREHRGRGRYSLWTGDLGVAVYAADCLEARARYPVVETWD